MKLKPVQHLGDKYRLSMNITFEHGMVIHMRAKLGYVIEDIAYLNNVYFEKNAIKISQWSKHKPLQLNLKTNNHEYDPNKYPGVRKLRIKCTIRMVGFSRRRTWTLHYNERKQEFTYNHLVEKARKAVKQKKIYYVQPLTCELIVKGPDGENTVSNQQDFEKYCINAPDPLDIHMKIKTDYDDTSSGESAPADHEEMTIECAVFIDGYRYRHKWMLYDENRTYDNLVVQASRVVNYENIKFIFIIDGKYQVSNQREFVKYCINAPNPHYVEMEMFINSHTLWMPA